MSPHPRTRGRRGWRSALRAGTLFLALSPACGGDGPDSLTWQESWEVFGLSDDGQALRISTSVGNTGLLRGQGHSRLVWLGGGQTAVDFHRSYAPVQVQVAEDHRSVQLGGEQSGQLAEGETWTVELGHEELAAVVHIEPEGDPAPRTEQPRSGSGPDEGAWTVQSLIPGGRMTGWLEAGQRGGMLRGRAVVLHRFGDRLPPEPRTAVFVLGPDISIGADLQGGARLLWAEVDGQILDPPGVKLTNAPGKPVVLDFRPELDLVVRVRRRKPRHEQRLDAHLSSAEGALLRALSWPAAHTLQAGVAEVLFEGERHVARGLMLESATASSPTPDAPTLDDAPLLGGS